MIQIKSKISRRNLLIAGLAGAGLLLEEGTAGLIRKYLSGGGAEAHKGAFSSMHTQNILDKIGVNINDYITIHKDGSVSFEKLDESTKKLGYAPYYGLFPKTAANDNVMNNGFFSQKPEIYSGRILGRDYFNPDKLEDTKVVFFNEAFLDTEKELGRFGTADGDKDVGSDFKWHKPLLELENYGYHVLSGADEIYFQLFPTDTTTKEYLFGSPDKTVVAHIRKSA